MTNGPPMGFCRRPSSAFISASGVAHGTIGSIAARTRGRIAPGPAGRASRRLANRVRHNATDRDVETPGVLKKPGVIQVNQRVGPGSGGGPSAAPGRCMARVHDRGGGRIPGVGSILRRIRAPSRSPRVARVRAKLQAVFANCISKIRCVRQGEVRRPDAPTRADAWTRVEINPISDPPLSRVVSPAGTDAEGPAAAVGLLEIM